MRPRPDAAENRRWNMIGLIARDASMRPRPDAAENPVSAPLSSEPSGPLQ